MRIKLSLVVKKAVILALMVAIGWQLLGMVKDGLHFFPIAKVFSFELFMTERLEPIAMMEAAEAEVFQEVRNAWLKEKLDIRFVPEGTKRVEQLNASLPTVFLVYREEVLNGRLVKNIVDLVFNTELENLLREKFSLEGHRYGAMNVFMLEPWKWMLADANFYNQDYHAQLGQEFSELVYSFAEMRLLRTTGVALSMLHNLTHVLQDDCRLHDFNTSTANFKCSRDGLTNQALSMYAPYFYEQRPELCWLASAKHKATVILWLVSLIGLGLHLFRLDLGTALSRELAARSIRMPFLLRCRIMADNWPVVLFSASRKKRAKCVEKAITTYRAYDERRQSEAVAVKAKLVWADLLLVSNEMSLSDNNHLKACWEVVSRPWMENSGSRRSETTLPHRLASLAELENALKRIKEEKQAPVALLPGNGSGNGSSTKRPVQEGQRLGRKERAIAELFAVWPDCVIDFDSWNPSRIENLRLAIIQLRGANHSWAAKLVALPDPNLKTVLQSKSRFMESARLGDQRGMISALEKQGKNGIVNHDQAEIKSNVHPTFSRVTIIGGGRTPVKEEDYIQTVKDFGWGNVGFIYVDKVRQVRRAIDSARKNPEGHLVIVLTETVPHGYVSFDREAVSWIPVASTGTESFRQELSMKISQL